MLRDLSLATKSACSKEDQETLTPIIKQLVELSDQAAKKGLLSLEGELGKVTDPLLKIGLQLIIDKIDQDNIRDILDSDIYYNESNGRELLKKIIIREGLLRIQAGDPARIVKICTTVFLNKVPADFF